MGIGWKIDNGTQISIRDDNWLSDCTFFKLYNPQSVPVHLRKVADIIDKTTNSWNKNLFSN